MLCSSMKTCGWERLVPPVWEHGWQLEYQRVKMTGKRGVLGAGSFRKHSQRPSLSSAPRRVPRPSEGTCLSSFPQTATRVLTFGKSFLSGIPNSFGYTRNYFTPLSTHLFSYLLVRSLPSLILLKCKPAEVRGFWFCSPKQCLPRAGA